MRWRFYQHTVIEEQPVDLSEWVDEIMHHLALQANN
jgi:hypothetical protein